MQDLQYVQITATKDGETYTAVVCCLAQGGKFAPVQAAVAKSPAWRWTQPYTQYDVIKTLQGVNVGYTTPNGIRVSSLRISQTDGERFLARNKSNR